MFPLHEDQPFRFQQNFLSLVGFLSEIPALHNEVHVLSSSSPDLVYGQKLGKTYASPDPYHRELV